MESQDIDQIRNLLIQWLDNLTANSNASLICFPKSNANLPDQVDMASAQSEMEYAANRLCRDLLNKDSIIKALEKMEEGTYGICESCEEEIPIKRLRAIPDAKFCIACQSQMEKKGSRLIA